MRAIAELGLNGACGTGAITLAAILFRLPFLAGKTHVFRDTGFVGVVSLALGGAAFALYSIGFFYGKVALVVLLWFFSPVWSVLIAKFVLRWQVPTLRLIAIGVGLVGLFIMLGGEGGLPVPCRLGEWMAFIGGLVWAGATAGMRLKSRVPPLPAAFMFALGATMTSFALAPFLKPLPTIAAADAVRIGISVLVTGGVWWELSIAALMWATLRLDPVIGVWPATRSFLSLK